MQKWEYRQIVRLKKWRRNLPSPWEDDPDLLKPSLERLNDLGEEGWRLVSTSSDKRGLTYYLMRPKTE
jgi:hypothetical protein